MVVPRLKPVLTNLPNALEVRLDQPGGSLKVTHKLERLGFGGGHQILAIMIGQ